MNSLAGTRPSKDQGFTLVELMVTIAIIGALAGIGYVSYTDFYNTRQSVLVESHIRSLTDALDRVGRSGDGYPVPVVGESMNVRCFDENLKLTHDCDTALIVEGDLDETLIPKNIYKGQMPVDPFTGRRYRYAAARDGSSFTVAGNRWTQKGWRAEVSSQVHYEFPVESLIMAFDRDQFVHQNYTNLPYSPYDGLMTARLQVERGFVQAWDHNADPIQELDLIPAGSRILVPTGGEALLFLADGSVVRLGSETSETDVVIDAASAITQDDIKATSTRVKLRVEGGRVWTKAVRLSNNAEFSVESDSAVAGVRGTEFLVDGDTNELVVYKGSVWVGENIDANLVEVTGDQPPKRAAMTANGPQAVAEITDPVELEALEELRDPAGRIFGGTTPFIVHHERDVSGPATVGVSFNGSETEDIYDIDGFEIFGHSQVESPGEFKDGALESPLLDVTSVTYDDTSKTYVFELDYSQSATNPIWQNEWQDGTPVSHESLIVRAYSVRDDGSRRYSGLSSPPLGLLSSQPTELTVSSFKGDQTYRRIAYWDEIAGYDPEPAAPIIALADVCDSNGGLWQAAACWIMGGQGESCDAACGNFGDAYNVDGGVACSDESQDWNDDSTSSLCLTFNPGADGGFVTADEFAPLLFSIPDPDRCFYREGGFPVNCGAQAPSRQRLCRCE